jgi:hypothetical protein
VCLVSLLVEALVLGYLVLRVDEAAEMLIRVRQNWGDVVMQLPVRIGRTNLETIAARHSVVKLRTPF